MLITWASRASRTVWSVGRIELRIELLSQLIAFNIHHLNILAALYTSLNRCRLFPFPQHQSEEDAMQSKCKKEIKERTKSLKKGIHYGCQHASNFFFISSTLRLFFFPLFSCYLLRLLLEVQEEEEDDRFHKPDLPPPERKRRRRG